MRRTAVSSAGLWGTGKSVGAGRRPVATSWEPSKISFGPYPPDRLTCGGVPRPGWRQPAVHTEISWHPRRLPLPRLEGAIARSTSPGWRWRAGCAQVSQDDASGIVSGRTADLAAGMRPSPAHIQPGYRRPVATPFEQPIA